MFAFCIALHFIDLLLSMTALKCTCK